MLGGLAMGQIVDKLSSKTGVIINVLSIVVACCFALAQIRVGKLNWISYMLTFSWGF